jgi:uncharacterized protein YbaA (DUF1428 family)
MSYIDGLITAVPTKNKKIYMKHAKQTAKLFKEFGAVKVVECWGDDVPPGKLTSFPLAVKCKKDETVVLSWIEWPTKAARNKGMKKVMSDPRMMNMDMPFDGSRMIFGGFKIVLSE